MSRKATIGLAASILVVAAMIWALFGECIMLQNQVSNVNDEKDGLEAQITTLEVDYENKMATHSHNNSEYSALEEERDQLQEWLDGNVTAYLREPDLDGYANISGLVSITVEGFVWNYGMNTTYDVSVNVTITYREAKVHSVTEPIGDVQGRAVVPFEVSLTYAGLWDDWYWTAE